MRYQEIEVGQKLSLGARSITPLPANHTVPAVGYHLDSGAASLVFSGDTGQNDALWAVVNRIANLKFLIIETAFSDEESELACLSQHLCPKKLGHELAHLAGEIKVHITHIKPGEVDAVMAEVGALTPSNHVSALRAGQVLELA